MIHKSWEGGKEATVITVACLCAPGWHREMSNVIMRRSGPSICKFKLDSPISYRNPNILSGHLISGMRTGCPA